MSASMDDGTAPPLSLETVSLVASEATDPAAANGLDENVPLASGGIYVPDKTESLKGMAFNLANSTIGAGVLALAFAVRESGYALGGILLIAFAVLADYSLQLMVRAADMLGQIADSNKTEYFQVSEEQVPEATKERPAPVEYEEVAFEAFGKVGYILVSISTILINFGAATGYLAALDDLVLPVIVTAVISTLLGANTNIASLGWSHTILYNRYFMVTLLSVLVVFPLTLPRNFASLRFSSYVSIFGLLCFMGMAVVYFFITASHTTDFQAFKFSWNVFLTAPLFTFAYACHTNLMNAYSELAETQRPRMNRVVHATVGLVFFTYATSGEIGYLTFGEATKHNILSNYPNDSVFINIIRIVIAISVLLSYPMCSFPGRHSINMLILLFQKGDSRVHTEQISWARNLIIIIPWFLTTLLIALLFSNIVSIFGLTGSTASTIACYIMPPLVYLQVKRQHFKERYLQWKNWHLLGLIVVGGLLGIISTVVIIIDMANPQQDE